MKISVIVPCLNAADTIGLQLEALAHQDYAEPWELIIADNGSTDQTAQVVTQFQQKIPGLRFLDASNERGSSFARNSAASVAQGDFLLFCDADDEVSPGWITAMARALEQHDLVAGECDLRRLNEDWVYLCCADERGGVTDHPYHLPYAGTNNLGIRRAIHDTIGGFDLALLALQDADYCWRAQYTGIRLELAKDAIISFRFRSSLKKMCQRSYKQGVYNVLVHKKHGLRINWARVVMNGAVSIPKLLIKIFDKPGFAKQAMHLAWCLGHFEGRVKFG